jgi:hypothetical protein
MQQGEVSLAPTLALVMSTCTNMIAGLPVVGSCTWLAWQSSHWPADAVDLLVEPAHRAYRNVGGDPCEQHTYMLLV